MSALNAPLATPDAGPRLRVVPLLPDLIAPEDYGRDPAGRQVQLRLTDGGLRVLGDAARVTNVDAISGALEPEFLEIMVCG